MNKNNKKIAAALTAALVFGINGTMLSSAADLTKEQKTETLSGTAYTGEVGQSFKTASCNNPLSSEVFCADPTAVEYNGRLYVFGTNDHQQYNEKGADADNTYEKIRSLVVFSTDDMVNWIYHGEINVGEIAPWILNSWAPSITSRVEEDGLTHFYMYFSNNGTGVGVITATDPLGPWSDPLGEPLVSYDSPGIGDCPNPFDPGVVIDDNGVGWLSFGGGKAANGTDYMPGTSRIVRLGEDMLSFDSDIAEIPAPYFFEASELNYINGTYVYTYCSDWSDHSKKWDFDCDVPGQCSMIYMTSTDPLDPDSWEMKGECLKNPGVSGFDYSNNHTHLQKFKDNWYMLYHTLSLKSAMGIKGGYRSLCADNINVDEESVTIEDIGGTKKGADAANSLDPYSAHSGAELHAAADVTLNTSDMSVPTAVSGKAGAWTSVSSAEFTETSQTDGAPSNDEPILTGVDTIEYRFKVTNVDKDTVITIYPSSKAEEVQGSVSVSGNGEYSIICDLGGSTELQNLGYFRASDNASVTFELNSIVINGKYEFTINSELTNTREWADGLKNIWGGFADGAIIYESENAVFKYIEADGAIEFFLIPESNESNGNYNKRGDLVFLASVKGSGRIEVRLDSPNGELLTSLDFDSEDDFTTIYSKSVTEAGGTHDLYFVYSDSDIEMKYWQFSDLENYDNVSDDSSSQGSSSQDQSSQDSSSQDQPESDVSSSINDTSSVSASSQSKASGGSADSTGNPDTGAGGTTALLIAACSAAIITVDRKGRK